MSSRFPAAAHAKAWALRIELVGRNLGAELREALNRANADLLASFGGDR